MTMSPLGVIGIPTYPNITIRRVLWVQCSSLDPKFISEHKFNKQMAATTQNAACKEFPGTCFIVMIFSLNNPSFCACVSIIKKLLFALDFEGGLLYTIVIAADHISHAGCITLANLTSIMLTDVFYIYTAFLTKYFLCSSE